MKEIKWLYGQLPTLIENGILTEEVAQNLKNHYGEVTEKPSYNLAFLLMSVLGAVLIGAGIIAIFAYNWEDFSRTTRTVLSFLPLLVAQGVYGYTFFKKRDSMAWVEASSGFLMLMLAACLALLNQTYHIGDNSFASFLWLWLLLSIPLMYLMNATLPTLFYLVGICSLAMNLNYHSQEGIWYWAFLAAAIPHLYLNTDPKQPTIRGTLLGWTLVITLAIALPWAVYRPTLFFMQVGSSLLILLFYLLGKYCYATGKNIWQRPFQTSALFSILAISLVLSYFWGMDLEKETFEIGFGKYKSTTFLFISFLILGVLGILYHLQQKNYLNPFVLVLPILMVLGYFLSTNHIRIPAKLLANAYLFTFGIYYLYHGIQDRKMGLVNAGMLFMTSIIALRFFDANISFLFKGVIFILLGMCFLYVNYYLTQKLKKDEQAAI